MRSPRSLSLARSFRLALMQALAMVPAPPACSASLPSPWLRSIFSAASSSLNGCCPCSGKRAETMLNGNIAALLYLSSGVLFILALRGLSSPETARQGNRFGVIGMAIAAATTLLYQLPSGFSSFFFVLVAVGIGGSIGAWRARTIQMTAMPQLVALFHALVGLAAVLVAASALYAPQAFGLGSPIHAGSLVEMSLGAAIGALTFTGSI